MSDDEENLVICPACDGLSAVEDENGVMVNCETCNATGLVEKSTDDEEDE